MKAGQARGIAEDWVREHASPEEWFLGAYSADPSSSCQITTNCRLVQTRSRLSQHLLKTAEEVLSSYRLAGSFRTNAIIADPTGHLQRLQLDVGKHFADKRWVRCRCQNAMRRIKAGTRSDSSGSTHS
ncbi:hypothetical protein [Fictibacillus sp. NRS-1165]|uniref:hypothetical protein n=1 Tax=Fictibacillus sp. NRS-1165 TaxID=3144463 RepID=UPI003D1F6A4A